MTDSPEPTPVDPERAREEYGRLKHRARRNLMGCLAGLVFCLGCCLLPGTISTLVTYLTLAPWQVSAGEAETVLLIEMGQLLGKMFWAALFAFAIAGGIISIIAKKAKSLETPAIIVFGIVAPGCLLYWVGYQEFVAVRTRQGMVELRYLWPRPARQLDAFSLGPVRAVETDQLSGGDGNHPLWVLEVEADHVVYWSQLTRLQDRAIDARRRLLREKYQTLLRALETSSGPEHADVATPLNALAQLLVEEKKDGDAEPLFQRALRITEETEGPESLRATTATYGLASIHHTRKQYEQAKALYERTMAIQAKHLDPQHPDCWDTFWSYQALLRETGQASEGDILPRTPYTLLDHLRRTHGKEGAERLIRDMIEKRRRDREH